MSTSKAAAGGGRAAATELGAQGRRSNPEAGLEPVPPRSPPSGRPHPEVNGREFTNGASNLQAEEEWCTLFRSLPAASGSNSRSSSSTARPSEALEECASLAAQLERQAVALADAGRRAGLDEGDVSRIVCMKLFMRFVGPGAVATATSSTNPQEAQKEDAKTQYCSDKQSSQEAHDGVRQKKVSVIDKGRASICPHILRMKTGDLKDSSKASDDAAADDLASTACPSEGPQDDEVDIVCDKYSYLQDHVKKLHHGNRHPLYEAMVEKGGDVAELKRVLVGVSPKELQENLDDENGLPSAIFYAITPLASPATVQLLIKHTADVTRQWSGPHNWDYVTPGLTPLAAVKILHHGDSRVEAIEELLKNELGRLEAAKGKPDTAIKDPKKACKMKHVRSLTWSENAMNKALQDADEEDTEDSDSGNSGAEEEKEKKMKKRVSLASGLATEPVSGLRSGRPERRRSEKNVGCRASLQLPTSKPRPRRHSTVGAMNANSHTLSTANVLFVYHMEGRPQEVYHMEEKVGCGTFGTVQRAVHKTTGEVHAVKTCPKQLIPCKELWAEIDIMKQLDHPHIMRLYHTFEDQNHVYISSELCNGGQLFDAILEAGAMSECTASVLFKQVLSAVSYIHFKNICHRDLKPENFLIAKKGAIADAKVKLIDFGTAKRFDLTPLTTKVCTVHYVAPEVLKRNLDPYTEKVDVWSCGVILFVMLSGSPPFHSESDLEIMRLVKKGKWEYAPARVWDYVSAGAKDLISHMLCIKVPDRFSSNQSMHHDWCVQEGKDTSVNIDTRTIMQMRAFVAHNKLKKVALQIIARQVSDEHIERLRQMFLNLDHSHSGALTVKEMDKALIDLDIEESVRLEMQQVMVDLDMDGNGSVDYTEFIAATIEKQHYLKEEVCRAAFHVFDVDADGIISHEDMKCLLRHDLFEGDCMRIGMDEIQQIMTEVDKSGTITFDQFMQLMDDDNSASIARTLSGPMVTTQRCHLEPANLTRLSLACPHEDEVLESCDGSQAPSSAPSAA